MQKYNTINSHTKLNYYIIGIKSKLKYYSRVTLSLLNERR